MSIIKQEDWNEWVKDNKDPYGKRCVDVAYRVMKTLDENNPFDSYSIICTADNDFEGEEISGFMASCVARIVSHCHSRGKEFLHAWNEDVQEWKD